MTGTSAGRTPAIVAVAIDLPVEVCFEQATDEANLLFFRSQMAAD